MNLSKTKLSVTKWLSSTIQSSAVEKMEEFPISESAVLWQHLVERGEEKGIQSLRSPSNWAVIVSPGILIEWYTN